MKRLASALFGCLLSAGLFACGGQKGTLSVNIVTPPGDDPFAAATQVRMTLGDKIVTSPVSGGKFDASLQIDSPGGMDIAALIVEALDGSGQAIGRGRTPSFTVQAMDGSATVYVGRPGRVTATDQLMTDQSVTTQSPPQGRRDLSGAVLRGPKGSANPGLGTLIVGGLDGSGKSLADSWFFDPASQKFVGGGKSLKARHGAVTVPSADASIGEQVLIWGGAVALGGGGDTEQPTTAELFDLSATDPSRLFGAPVMDADAGAPGALAPVVAELDEDNFLVCGGTDAGGLPQSQAVLLGRIADSTGNTTHGGVQRLPPMGMTGPMLAPRSGHSATHVTLAEGPGALLFGGVGPAQPVAEVFVAATKTFRKLDLGPVTMGGPAPSSRKGHVAAALSDGRVLIAGGVDATQQFPTDALIIDSRSGAVQALPAFFTTPRQAATASVVGPEIVICGGLDKDQKAIANCEIFSAQNGTRTRDPVPLPTPRAGHIALYQANTQQLLLVGGIGSDMQPLASLDIYTAP